MATREPDITNYGGTFTRSLWSLVLRLRSMRPNSKGPRHSLPGTGRSFAHLNLC